MFESGDGNPVRTAGAGFPVLRRAGGREPDMVSGLVRLRGRAPRAAARGIRVSGRRRGARGRAPNRPGVPAVVRVVGRRNYNHYTHTCLVGLHAGPRYRIATVTVAGLAWPPTVTTTGSWPVTPAGSSRLICIAPATSPPALPA